MSPEIYEQLRNKMTDKCFGNWVDVCETISETDALVRVCRVEDRGTYVVLRAFMIGGKPEVSYDAYECDAEEMTFQLMRVMGKPNAAVFMENQI